MKRNESKQPLTDAEKLAKRQKRARHDIRTAWRNMTMEDRAVFLREVAGDLGRSGRLDDVIAGLARRGV